ncbi:hypothetical protein [Spirosoma koreense]
MKTLLTIFFVYPLTLWAQIDTTHVIRPQTLKPIESEFIPGHSYSRYGGSARTQYIYDGLDVRHPKDLAPYILASGDPNAIGELNKYLNSRQTGNWLIAGGVVTAIVGGIIMGSNGPGSDGKFTMQQPYVCPTGYACGGNATAGTLVYGGQIAGYQTVTDTRRQNAFGAGGATLLGGVIMAGVGWGMHLPGQHFRRAVQYYNRSLKQQGISWHVSPYATFGNSGLGVIGHF